jgi:hypothetical protein
VATVPSVTARAEAEIFADLAALCTSQGYIHTIAYFCCRDNLIRYSGPRVVAKDLDHYRSQDKLIRTEISALIGLMVQRAIDLSLPSPTIFESYVARTEAVLHELHRAMQKPWQDAWDFNTEPTLRYDPFSTAAGMREPIFYCGESAYNFQYREFAAHRYRSDEPWIETNKGFRIEDASQIAEVLEKLQPKRLREHIQSSKREPPDKLTVLPGFMFTAQDVGQASGLGVEKVERFLESFSCGPNERNVSFAALNEFNITNAKPILKNCTRIVYLASALQLA